MFTPRERAILSLIRGEEMGRGDAAGVTQQNNGFQPGDVRVCGMKDTHYIQIRARTDRRGGRGARALRERTGERGKLAQSSLSLLLVMFKLGLGKGTKRRALRTTGLQVRGINKPVCVSSQNRVGWFSRFLILFDLLLHQPSIRTMGIRDVLGNEEEKEEAWRGKVPLDDGQRRGRKGRFVE